MELLLGIDIGTTGCKAALYDVNGDKLSEGYRSYELMSVHGGWAEENPDEWWTKTVEAINDCRHKCSAEKMELLAICVSCTNGVVPVGKSGRALYRAVMQVNRPSKSQSEVINKLIEDNSFLEITGNRPTSGGYSAAALLWLKRSMPEIYANTYKFLTPSGFIVHKLTGKFTMDFTRGSTTALMDIKKLKWSDEICKSLGIDMAKLPELFPSEHVAGGLNRAAARETSFPEGTPVCVGIMDSSAAVIGSGCGGKHKVSLIIGTVSRLCVPMDEPIFKKEFLNSYLTPETPYLAMAPTNGGGASLRWFVNAFGEREKTIGETVELDPYEVLDIKAAEVKPGCGGLLYLPYILGERSPIWDLNARGVFFGVTAKHEKAHFTRAIMEGVAHSTLQNLKLMEVGFNCRFSDITISGGGAKSSLWCEIMSNMLGKTLLRHENSDSETKGAAFTAGIAAGAYGSYKEAVRFYEVKSMIRPKSTVTDAYKRLNGLYQSLYIHLKDDFTYLSEIMGDENTV